MAAPHSFFATCPKGLESLLLDELASLGATAVKETVGGVSFGGGLDIGYRACLWSRLANRVLLILAVEPCASAQSLYESVKAIEWQDHLSIDHTFAIDFSGQLKDVRHTHFGALKVKDALADYFTERFGRRPNVNADQPDVLINARVNKGRLTVSIDLSGDSLHKRGYRLEGGKAPLKENLAAAILLRADWPAIAARGGALLDPMCGSGTLLIEGALMAGNIAPGIARKRWGFSRWLGHVPQLWQQLLEDARDQHARALLRQWPEIRGYDAAAKAVAIAQQNIERAGLRDKVRVSCKELSQFSPPTHTDITAGLVMTNPPYGERLGEASALVHLYQHLGERLRSDFMGWKAAVFTGNPDLGKRMGLHSRKQYQFYNGPIASKLLMFDVSQEQVVHAPPAPLHNDSLKSVDDRSAAELSDGAQMFANRLRKNIKTLQKWAEKNQLSCYRLYDADMPEYAVAIDRYNDWLHIAEYAPPKKVDEVAAQQRFNDVVAAAQQVLAIPRSHIAIKQRRRQRGAEQYQKYDQQQQSMEVTEGQCRLLVNLTDYLDTGLFLDHRPVRLDIAARSKGQRFLNLFCYTASASVHAAVGGARWTDSVDMSATYLDWARRNFALNGLSESKNRLHRADVRVWLKECQQQYDLILLDPPTFSNSKKMEGVLDIQRDHVELIDEAMRCLSLDGVLIFSNNHRRFKLDEQLQRRYRVEDRTRWSMDRDFQRSANIHQCWYLTQP